MNETIGSIQSDQTETLKTVVCSTCDGFCPVAAKVKDGRVVKVTTREHPFFKDILCMKGAYAPKAFAHPDRLHYPLKRIGERGDGQWQQVSWDAAMDDIAERLQHVIRQYGPEAFAVSGSNANISLDNGLSRRFMNLVGSPNYTSGVAYCMGNTAAVNRMVYGWYPRGDILNSKCIVLFGHDPRRHSWTLEYKSIRTAQAGGAKLIVLDPRKSENAEAADIWLPLRAGTDAAMSLGWMHVILEEELYDKDFVRDWTVGFDAFADRVRDYPLDRVADITGVDADLIARAARMYATASPAVIPWSPITDQQVSSTSAIRLQCALRALTGNLDVKGGEMMAGFHPGIRSDTEVEMHEALSEVQKQKQLGADQFPVFTYRGMAPLGEATERVWGNRWANLIGGCYLANPHNLFKAMADGDPYPVKAFFALANNTHQSYANTKRIHDGLMNQDLIVAYEHMLTPTAQLADYVLPGDAWLERPSMMAGISEQAMEPPGDCKSVVYFWCELAKRMGLAEHFPWKSPEELFDFRLEPGGMTWQEAVDTGRMPKAGYEEKKYEKTGFATPSGKVELFSSVLEDLGFDPLPYYREAAVPSDEFPLSMFIGLPDDEYYRTGHRHIPELRQRAQDPALFVSADDARAMNLEDGDWARVTTSTGAMLGRVFVRSSMPKGLVRVPHGWWKPESKAGLENMSGMWDFSDAQITADDDPDLVDLEQGVPHLKGAPCRLTKLNAAELTVLEAKYGPTDALPRGPEAKVLRSTKATVDFMQDQDFDDDIEFEAVELSLYGKSSL
jgi:anaerobic selenocysteine-containing dehydrogenase